jgi:hypothetical protein
MCTHAINFSPRLKALEKYGWDKCLCGIRIFSNVLKMKDNNSFLYAWTTL